ncbi:MAG: hypothetical protein AMK70_03795, partial [Nitrospira bacterium SG8_35_1]
KWSGRADLNGRPLAPQAPQKLLSGWIYLVFILPFLVMFKYILVLLATFSPHLLLTNYKQP